MKKQEFNSKLLGLLSYAFLDKILTKPKSNDLFSSKRKQNENIDLFFSIPYYEQINEEIKNLYYKGQFANNNSASEWSELMIKINTAIDTEPAISGLNKYWLSSSEDQEESIEVDFGALNIVLDREINMFNSLDKKMHQIAEDLAKIYLGHNIQHNWYGYLTIERPIEKNSMFPSELNIIPLLSIVRKYGLEFDTIKIKSNLGSDKIYLETYLK